LMLVTLSDSFAVRPPMHFRAAGYGAGSRETPGNANVLRITLGERLPVEETLSAPEEVAVIEATVDDMSPQVYGYFQEKALAAGALDVYATSVQMKKNRPAVKLTLVCGPGRLEEMSRLVFSETTTIGIRYNLARRKTLQREM